MQRNFCNWLLANHCRAIGVDNPAVPVACTRWVDVTKRVTWWVSARKGLQGFDCPKMISVDSEGFPLLPWASLPSPNLRSSGHGSSPMGLTASIVLSQFQLNTDQQPHSDADEHPHDSITLFIKESVRLKVFRLSETEEDVAAIRQQAICTVKRQRGSELELNVTLL